MLWGLGHQSKSKKEALIIMKIYLLSTVYLGNILLSTVYLGKYHFLSGSTHTKRSFPPAGLEVPPTRAQVG